MGRKLRRLHIGDNHIEAQGCKHLSHVSQLEKFTLVVEDVDLWQCWVFRTLTKKPNFRLVLHDKSELGLHDLEETLFEVTWDAQQTTQQQRLKVDRVLQKLEQVPTLVTLDTEEVDEEEWQEQKKKWKRKRNEKEEKEQNEADKKDMKK